jgi:hypothetical protein
MNDLLLWMSAKSFGTQQSFRAKVAEFDGGGRGSIARHRLAEWNLSKLAHAEFRAAPDGADWRVTPPVLAADDFQGRAILCGARTPTLSARLVVAAGPGQVEIRHQSAGPDVIQVCASNAPALAAISKEAAIPVQWNAPLAALAAGTSPNDATLQPTTMPIGGWTVTRFSRSQLGWVDSSAQEAAKARFGLFRFRSEYGTAYILIEGGQPWACEPAQAKFRILGRRSRALIYDSTAYELQVRSSCRPPSLVERALVLCSGHLPAFREGYFIYTHVERSMAGVVAELLGQRLY